MYGYVYKTTDLKTNKIYIGQHKSNIFEGIGYIGSGRILQKIIRKCKENNIPLSSRFKVEMLCEAFTKEELNLKEQLYIKELNSQKRDIGYNIADGGCGGDMVKGRVKINNGNIELWYPRNEKLPNGFLPGVLNKGEKHPLFGSHFHWYNNGKKEVRVPIGQVAPFGYRNGRLKASITTKEKISNNHKSVVTNKMIIVAREHWSGDNNPQRKNPKFGAKNPFYGKHHSIETLKKNSEAHKVRYNCPFCEYSSNRSHLTIHINNCHFKNN